MSEITSRGEKTTSPVKEIPDMSQKKSLSSVNTQYTKQ